jgi:hypothetical protein
VTEQAVRACRLLSYSDHPLRSTIASQIEWPTKGEAACDSREVATVATELRDRWDKFDIIIKAIGTLLLPIIILIASNRFTTQQKMADAARLTQQSNIDAAQRNADRMALLLTHLASENPRERLLAVSFVEYLAQTNQFPQELLPIVLNSVNDNNTQVAHAASHALTQAVKLNPTLRASVAAVAKTNTETRKTLDRAARFSPALRRFIPPE